MELFKQVEFNKSEMHEIAKVANTPAFQKYLRSLAYNNAVAIASIPQDEGMSDSEYIRKQEQLRGGIAMVETLLNIKPAEQEEPSQPQS